MKGRDSVAESNYWNDKHLSRTLSRRLSRRRLIQIGALGTAGAVSAACVGCGDGDEKEKKTPAGSGTATGTPKRGGVIRSSILTPILTLDPNSTQGMSSSPFFYSYLVHVTDWQGTVGDLAKSWEVVDDLEWIFKLREDVRFQDIDPVNGRLLTSEDVLYTMKRVETMPGASPEWAKAYAGRETPDSHTIVIRTVKPEGYLLDNVGSPLLAVVPAEAVEKYGDLTSNATGSGPFMLQKWGRNEGLDVVRNPTYYHEFPYIDGHSLRVIPDDASIGAAFRAGSLDVYVAPDKIRADAMKDVNGVTVQSYRGRKYSIVMLNGTKLEAFKDERVREAVDLAIDRKTIIDRLYFGDAELSGPVPPVFDSSLPAEEVEAAYQTDVVKAKQLLSAASAESLSFRLTCTSATAQSDLASVIKANLEKADIQVDMKLMEFGTYLGELMAGNFEAAIYEHGPYLADDIPIQWHHSRTYLRTEALYLGVDDPEVDNTLEQIQQTVDYEERVRMAQEMQRKVLKRHGPTLVLFQPRGYWCAYDYLKGYVPTAYGFGMYKYDVWIDKG